MRGFWERWTTDPLFARPKQSSDIRRREQTKIFVERYGDMPLVQVGDAIVAEWLTGGSRAGSIQGLHSMSNDAASVKAGRLIDRNPFQKLGVSRGRGRRDQQPPSEQQVWEMIDHARKLACPSFAAWLQVAAFTGLRPGELDALRWERIDFGRDWLVVAERFSAATRTFDTPKNHLRRDAPLTAHARSALQALPQEGESSVSSRCAASTGHQARAPITGRPSEQPQARREASTSPPATSLDGTWSTNWKWPLRT